MINREQPQEQVPEVELQELRKKAKELEELKIEHEQLHEELQEKTDPGSQLSAGSI